MSQLLPLLAAGLPYLGYAFLGTLLFLWLRKALTPTWVLQLFESEGVPSTRLVLATIVILFTPFMEAAGRIGDGLVQANFILAGTLLGLGTAKLVGKAFAARPSHRCR